MNEVNAYLQPLLLLLSVLILSGCPPPVEPEPRGPAYIEWDDWPVTPDGFDRFFTEDPRYSRSGGVAFWRVTSPAASPMTVLETQMKKISGDPKMGFGIIFCIQNDRFLLVKIDTEGYYGISRILGGEETVIQEWTRSDQLNTGYGKVNTLRAEYNAERKEFTLTINGGPKPNTETPEPITFKDSIDTGGPLGGAYGYMAGVSSKDRLPSTPVDVHFKQITPVPRHGENNGGSRQ